MIENEDNGDTNCNWSFWNSPQRLVSVLEELKIKKTSRDYLNYNNVEVGQNTEMSLGDLRRFAITQTPSKDHQLTLMWKTFKM